MGPIFLRYATDAHGNAVLWRLSQFLAYKTPFVAAFAHLARLQVKTASGATGMCMMPTKYRKLIWVARGDFLIASEAAADVVTASGSSGTVRFLVEHILREPQIGVLQIKGLW